MQKGALLLCAKVYKKVCGFFCKKMEEKSTHKMLVKLTKGLTWNEAYLGCKQLGARLPEIRTAAENADILKLQVR